MVLHSLFPKTIERSMNAKVELKLGTIHTMAEGHFITNTIHLDFSQNLISQGLHEQRMNLEDRRTGNKAWHAVSQITMFLMNHESLHLIVRRLEGKQASHRLDSIFTPIQPEPCGL